MTEAELIERTAIAINRDAKARADLERARTEANAAAKELSAAWADLREHQDTQVKVALAQGLMEQARPA